MSTLSLTATEVSRSYFTLQSIVCYAFYFSPITVSLLTQGVSAGGKWLRRRWSSMSAPANDGANFQDVQMDSDLPALRAAYSMMFTLQSVQVLLGIAEAVRPVYEALEPFSWVDRIMIISGGGSDFLESRTLSASLSPPTLFTSSTLVFLLYTVWDLRRRGYITNCKVGKAVLGLCSALIAPGAAYAGMWYWREEILYRTHRSRSEPQIKE